MKKDEGISSSGVSGFMVENRQGINKGGVGWCKNLELFI